MRFKILFFIFLSIILFNVTQSQFSNQTRVEYTSIPIAISNVTGITSGKEYDFNKPNFTHPSFHPCDNMTRGNFSSPLPPCNNLPMRTFSSPMQPEKLPPTGSFLSHLPTGDYSGSKYLNRSSLPPFLPTKSEQFPLNGSLPPSGSGPPKPTGSIPTRINQETSAKSSISKAFTFNDQEISAKSSISKAFTFSDATYKNHNEITAPTNKYNEITTNEDDNYINSTPMDENDDDDYTTIVKKTNNLATSMSNVIDQSNIASVLESGQLTASDVTKISLETLSSPEVIETLQNTDMDPSMLVVMKSKVADMLNSLPFDANRYALCGDLVPPQSLKKLSNVQALSIINSTHFVPDENTISIYGAKVGGLLLGASNNQIGGILKNSQKVLAGVDPVLFNGMLDKVNITDEFLSNLNDAVLTEKQSRDIYEKFMKDSVKNPETLSSADILKFASSLPSCVRQAIKADNVKNISPQDASNAIASIAPPPTLAKNSAQDVGAQPSDPSPTLYSLLDKMNKFADINDIKLLLHNNLLTGKIVNIIGKPICPIITNISKVNDSLSTSVLSAALDICIDDLNLIKNYGALARVFSPKNIDSMSPLNLLNNIPAMCKGQINLAQAEAALRILNPYIIKMKSLSNYYQNITCLIPLMSNLQDWKNQINSDNFCQTFSCQYMYSMPFNAIKNATIFCLENSPLRNLFCKGQGTSSILDSLPFSYFNASFNRANVLENLDLLQATITDCATRKYIYNLIKPYSLSNSINIAILGTLMDQLSLQELGSIKKTYLCGVLSLLLKIYAKWDIIYDAKVDAGLKSPDFCKRSTLLTFLMEVEGSTECSGSPGRKKKKVPTATLR